MRAVTRCAAPARQRDAFSSAECRALDPNVVNGSTSTPTLADPKTATIPPTTPNLNGDAAAAIAFDVQKESAKVPLDVLVFESICTVGVEERMRRLAGSITLVGGTSKIHNAGFALQSRCVVLGCTHKPWDANGRTDWPCSSRRATRR